MDIQEIFVHQRFDVAGRQQITGIMEAALEKEKHHAFDFGSGPLVRFTLFDFRGADFYMALTVSHIVTDAESMHIFWQELAATYNAFYRGHELHLKPASQYLDFSKEQAEYLLTAEYESQLT